MGRRYLNTKQINILRQLCFDKIDPNRNLSECQIMEKTTAYIWENNPFITAKKIYEIKRIIKDLDEMKIYAE
jgi:hypothetical protein